MLFFTLLTRLAVTLRKDVIYTKIKHQQIWRGQVNQLLKGSRNREAGAIAVSKIVTLQPNPLG